VVRYGHEYRFAVGLLGITYAFTGLIDALVEDWTLKYFLTLSFVVVLNTIIAYELICYPEPDHPKLEALLLGTAHITAVLGVHGAVWHYTSILLGRQISDQIWLAPHVTIPAQTYYLTTYLSLATYIAILLYINTHNKED